MNNGLQEAEPDTCICSMAELQMWTRVQWMSGVLRFIVFRRFQWGGLFAEGEKSSFCGF